MKRLKLFLSVIFFLFIPLTAYGNTEVTLRVGLVSNVNKVGFSVVAGEYILTDASTQMPIGYPQKGEEWVVLREGLSMKIAIDGMIIETPYLGPLLLIPQDTSKDNIFRCLGVSYRDSLVIQNDTNGLLAINNIGIEKYLYGVVGKEMGYSAPLEALKAQAVVSRTYALSNKGKSTKYDVGTDTSSQVYGGYDAELLVGSDKVKQAVDETSGLVLYYDGKLVNAFYHANAGGHTENSENVWLEKLPYIRAVSSPFDQYAVTYPYQTSSGWPANTYEWSVVYSRENLVDKIDNWNNRSSDKIEVGELLDIKLSKNQAGLNLDTPSGRVTRLDFIGTKGEKAITKDSIRSVLGLKSTLFDLLLDSTVYVLNEYGEIVEISRGDRLYAIGNSNLLSPLNGNDSNKYTVIGLGSTKVYPKLFNEVTINGKGHGHGLGMSQWGAQGMAMAGYKYDEILEYYYNQGKNNGSLSIEQYRN